MGKSDGLCKLCLHNTETLCHLLFQCDNIKPVWDNIKDFTLDCCNINLPVNSQNIVFSLKNKGIEDTMCNFIIYNTKWQIWKHRNKVKYGKERIQNSKNITSDIISLCKQDACTILQSKIVNWLVKKLLNILKSIKTHPL